MISLARLGTLGSSSLSERVGEGQAKDGVVDNERRGKRDKGTL